MAFDGIVTKAITVELQQLSGARTDKIFQPNKNNVIIGFYLNGMNYALNISIDSNNCRLHLTTHPKSNPQIAPNFCMILRKHLLGLKIKNCFTLNLERIVIIEFEGFDELDDIISKKLIIELMGRHSNIILTDDNNIIIDSLRHIKNSENTYRDIIPHIKYTFPNCSKFNFLDINDFTDFKSKIISDNNKQIILNLDTLPSIISNKFNGISKSFITCIINDLKLKYLNDNNLEQIYNYINQIINNIDTNKLDFIKIFDQNNCVKDYFPVIKDNNNIFKLNFFIDDFYYNKESDENFKNYRNTILKLILDILKKYNKKLININQKLKECDNMEKYKLYGELITANLYKIPSTNIEKIELENYYDNNMITINLDKRYSPSINAKRFFKKYNKLKNTLEIVSKQKKDTLKELDYIESIIYSLESSKTIDEVSEIFEEISENVIFKDKTNSSKSKKSSKVKKSKLTKNKSVSFNPIKYTYLGYTILVGRNNKENDYLTLKYASKDDIWFHTKNIQGSHVILRTSNNNINSDILIHCAQIAAYHSKASKSSNVPVDYCFVKYVKKPNGSKPGMVIYSNNHTLNVNPNNK